MLFRFCCCFLILLSAIFSLPVSDASAQRVDMSIGDEPGVVPNAADEQLPAQFRRQLVLYRFFMDPDMGIYPERGCPGCSMYADQLGNLLHLRERDTRFVAVSRGEQEHLQRYREHMGWEFPWYTLRDDFDADHDVAEWHGTNVFLRDGDEVYRTYFIDARGDEALGSAWSFLDITPYGRQEAWEDSPEGWPQTPPYTWAGWHDKYGRAL